MWARPNSLTLNDSLPVATTATPSAQLATPTGVRADAGNREITVYWNKVANAGGHTITWSPPHGGGTFNAGPNDIGYVITGLRNRTEYTITVKATTASAAYRDSADSAPATATPQAGPLATPTMVTANAAGSGEIAVSWQAVTFAEGYTLTWTPPDAGGSASVAGTATGHTITGLTNGTTYSVTVRATSTSVDYADSAESAPATATPQIPRLPAPGNVRLSGHRYADRNDPGKCFPCIDVSWNPVPGADGYRIDWRRTSGTADSGSQNVSDGTAGGAVLSGIGGTAIFAIRVTALSTGNDFRDSPASAERSITYSG